MDVLEFLTFLSLLSSKISGPKVTSYHASKLRMIKIKTADVEGAGMNGGLFNINNFGGGEFKLELCHNDTCCETPFLNSRDDNWEVGEINFFVGSQLGDCENFDIAEIPNSVELKHKGSNGGLLDYVQLVESTARKLEIHCNVGIKLDHDESLKLNCRKPMVEVSLEKSCNGHPDFCKLRFDQFVFPGSHNAGTGQSDGLFTCFFKNHDLNIREQLDFGLRFFDIDTTFSKLLPYCNGLETGHGALPDLGIYQCYGKIERLLYEVRAWMDEHPREVIVLYFGEINNEEISYPELIKVLRKVFDQDHVKMNKDFKTNNGSWPKLGAAVESNERIFVFIRSERVQNSDLEFVSELQIQYGAEQFGEHEEGVKILSTFKSKSVGSDCSFVLQNSREECGFPSDLVKISVFGSPGKGSRLGTECLWDIARKCNRQFPEAIQICNNVRRNLGFGSVNFVQVDFPNYPANGQFDLVQLCHDLNMENVQGK